MSKIASNKNKIIVPNTLEKVSIVKGVEENYLPNEYVPSSSIESGYFYKNEIPTKVLPLPSFPTIDNIKGFIFDDEIELVLEIKENVKDIFDYQKFYGSYGFLISYTDKNGNYFEQFTKQNKITIPYIEGMVEIKILPCFENNHLINSSPYFFVL